MNDFGWKMRSDILKSAAENQILDPLRRHGWTAAIERIEQAGEYIVVAASRNGLTRKAALLYSSATDNAVYKLLETEVDTTFFNGQPYHIEQYAFGLTRPVFAIADFHLRMLEWNRASVPDKLAPVDETVKTTPPMIPSIRERRLVSESPIDSIWSRLARLQSTKLARKAIVERAEAEGIGLEGQAATLKGDGVSYAIRNASDYFTLKNTSNVSQRVLNLYYGCVSFAFAEMLAAPTGPMELSRIEDITKQGHGLWTLEGPEDGFGNIAVGPLTTGLFSSWTQSFCKGPLLNSAKKPRHQSDLLSAPAGSWATLEQLFARIPEVGDLFEDIFTGPPAWITPAYDPMNNKMSGLFGSNERATTSYVTMIDDSGRMSADRIAEFPGPIREITAVPSGTRAGHFRAAIDHPDVDLWWKVLEMHHSPFERNALILPLFGGIQEYRAICVTILYVLSILVRYRVSLWRRIQEGDLDNLRALIETFLTVVERMMPEQFLCSITRERISIHLPGSFFT